MEHSMKVWEKILEGRLREIVEIDENQFGFQQGKSTVDAIFVMRQLRERYGWGKRSYSIFLWTWKKPLGTEEIKCTRMTYNTGDGTLCKLKIKGEGTGRNMKGV